MDTVYYLFLDILIFVFGICPIVKRGKLFIPVSFNTIFSFIGKLGFTEFCLIKFRPEPVSIIRRAGI